MDDTSLGVVIPARDEASTIGSVVAGSALRAAVVVVVDDGSEDSTASLAEEAGAQVIRHPQSKGYGAAILAGASFLRAAGVTDIATIDGDGVHDPRDLSGLLKVHRRTNSDLTIGTRFSTGKRRYHVPDAKRAANAFATHLFNLAIRTSVSDAASGMRILGPRFDLDSLAERGFGLTFEILRYAQAHGLSLCEAPISVRYSDAILHCTSRTEILQFLDFVRRSSWRNDLAALVSSLHGLVESMTWAQVRLGPTDFFFHPIRDYDALIIQAAPADAASTMERCVALRRCTDVGDWILQIRHDLKS